MQICIKMGIFQAVLRAILGNIRAEADFEGGRAKRKRAS